jgi:hypothetical protein
MEELLAGDLVGVSASFADSAGKLVTVHRAPCS